MKPKNISLANKCGSCCHFEPIEGTCSGYCLRNRYGENVVHDPARPYWQVQRSRLKCVYYNQKPPTNADHIRSMTDEELADFLVDLADDGDLLIRDWLKQPYKEDT